MERERNKKERKIPECVCSNGHNSLRTLFGGEARSVVEDVIGERGEMEARLVGVGEPGATRDCQHTLRTLHPHSEQLHRPRTQVPVGEREGCWSQHCDQVNTGASPSV